MNGMLRKGDLRKVQRKGPGRKVLLDMVVQNRSTDERVISENVLAFIVAMIVVPWVWPLG